MGAFDGIEACGERRGPVASLEFRRIFNLPRRDWRAAADLEEVRLGLTRLLKTPRGEEALLPIQAAALREIYEHNGGIFGPIGVGEGKTLILMLAPVMLLSQRPLMFVPASLRVQTSQYVIPRLREHWQLPPHIAVTGYEEMGLAKNADLLEEIGPDLLLLDEAHYLRNLPTGRTKRFARYMRQHPTTKVVVVSGTISSYSVMDYWHLIQWALQPGNSPVPRAYHEALEWSRALDERVRDEDRLGPGVLRRFCLAGENIRQGYRRRLVATPRVIATEAGKLETSLQVFGKRDLPVPREVSDMLRQIEAAWELPDGDLIEEAARLSQVRRSLLCGFWRKWIDPPPRVWLEARSAWHRYLRHVLTYNRRKLDTPQQVEDWERRHGMSNELQAWEAVKDSFEPRKKVVWVSDYLVAAACGWLARGPGICWVDCPDLGRRVAGASGVVYYGAGDDHIAEATGPIVASIKAHGTGKNLQQWCRNLVLTPPVSGHTWEQLLGRTHRRGQNEDTVTIDVMLHHVIFEHAMEQALKDARYLQDTLGNKQRLLYCDTDLRR